MPAIINSLSSFEDLKKSVAQTVKDLLPVEGKNRRLVVNNVEVDDNLNSDDVESQLDAKLRGGSWTVPVMADLSLVDAKTGEELNRSTVKVGDLPKLTNRATYIVNGREYSVGFQRRLKSGVYSRETATGNWEVQYNLKKGIGPTGHKGFILAYDPATRKIQFQVRAGRKGEQAMTLPAYSVLRGLGMTDSQMKKEFGDKMVEANAKPDIMKDLSKFYRYHTGEDSDDRTHLMSFVQDTFDKTQLLPDTTEITLGKPKQKVDLDALTRSIRKIQDVAAGRKLPDDRNSIEFAEFHGAEDLIPDRINRMGWKLQEKISNVIDKPSATKVREVVKTGHFNPQIMGFFTSGGTIANQGDQTNPLAIMSEAAQTTIMGEGGIADDRRVEEAAKMVSPSHLGFLDPIQTPEGERSGITLPVALGTARKGRNLLSMMFDVRKKRQVLLNPTQAMRANVAFPDQYEWKDGVPKPITSLIKVADKDGGISLVKPSEVDYVLPSALSMFGLSSSLVPFLPSNQGNRASMAVRQQDQAIALKYRETPLVQVKAGKSTLEKEFGSKFAAQISPFSGEVHSVSEKEVTIKDKDGKEKKIPLYHYFPLNEDGAYLHATPVVKVGQKLKPGDVVASTNFTSDDGTLALGVNLRTAYMPWKGLAFEDGVVISRSAAKKLTSNHLYREEVDPRTGIKLDKKTYLAHFGNKVTPEQAEKLDDEAIVKPGTEVVDGDVLVGSIIHDETKREHSKLAQSFRRKIAPYTDYTLRWNHGSPGVVRRVVHLPDGRISVHVETDEPAQIGDKIVARHANKGVVSCLSSDTEVLTLTGWKPAPNLSLEDDICTLSPDGFLEYHRPTSVIVRQHNGPMYSLSGRRINLLVTPDHNHYVRTHHRKTYRFSTSEEIFGHQTIHRRTGEWVAADLERVHIPGSELSYPADLFLEFFGFWVTEGSTGKKHQTIHIAQKKSVHPEEYERIRSCCERLGFRLWLSKTAIGFKAPEPLWAWLRSLGHSKEKYIPRSLLMASKRQLNILLEATMLGDGCTYYDPRFRHTRQELFTSSKRLADDYQELIFKAGKSANIKSRLYRGTWEYIVRISEKPEVWVNNGKHKGRKREWLEEWVPYAGTVHCVDVPNHTLYIRRQGIPVWTGNCIVEDEDMPRTPDGKPIEFIISPSTVPTRINPAQLFEVVAGKIAEKTGKTFVVENFPKGTSDYLNQMKKELAKNGLTDKEDLVDPQTGKTIPGVMTGIEFIVKQRHRADKKLMARGAGPDALDPSRYRYDLNESPASGGKFSAQTMDALGMWALLAHGATNNLREMQSVKGDLNAQFWSKMMAGENPPAPRIPMVYRKFEDHLRGLGLNVDRNGSTVKLTPATDEDVIKMVKMSGGGELKDPRLTLMATDLREEKGGLFDPVATGGGPNTIKGGGAKWSYFKLSERMPNPVFERGISSVLGLKEKDLSAILSGRQDLNGISGPKAIVHALKSVNVDKELAEAKGRIDDVSGSELDRVNRKIKYLSMLKEVGQSPLQAYTMSLVPVLPPHFRPIQVLPDGNLEVGDLNFHYKMVGHSNYALDNLDPLLKRDPEVVRTHEIALYDRLSKLFLTGITDKVGNRKQFRSGILSIIGGKRTEGTEEVQGSPKFSYFQDKLVGRRQDLSGRGVIVPDPSLSIDEVGLPRKVAMEIYRPFVVRRLTKDMGYTNLQALDAINNNRPAAMKALELETMDRPVLAKRDPVLHKFNVSAFKPRVIDGYTIRIHPLITESYNADFDGDQMSVYVPVQREAVEEAKTKMLPSSMLLGPANAKLMYPLKQEMISGLYDLSKVHPGEVKEKFSSIEEAIKAFRGEKVDPRDPVEIKGIGRTTAGRALIYQNLTPFLREKYGDTILKDLTGFKANKSQLNGMLGDLAKDPKGNGEWVDAAQNLMTLGNTWATETGITLGLDDITPPDELLSKIIGPAKRKFEQIAKSPASQKAKEKLTVGILDQLSSDVDKALSEYYNKEDRHSYLADMVYSGARGNPPQFRQMMAGPIMVKDGRDMPVPLPVLRPYTKGLDLADYWTTLHGARRGIIQKTQETAKPGFLTKQVVNSMMNILVAADDCETNDGLDTKIVGNEANLMGRYLAEPVRVGKMDYTKNTLITADVLDRMKANGVGALKVRSPLRCAHGEGVCAKCLGKNEFGEDTTIGTNVGVIAAQAIGEPSTQLMLDSFHTGSVAASSGAQSMSVFGALQDAIRVPSKIRGSAILAKRGGEITKVEEDTTTGGKRIYVGSAEHFLPPQLNPLLPFKPGMRVEAGQALTTGRINPNELLAATGDIHKVQDVLLNQLHSIMGPKGVRRIHSELLTRNMTDVAEVLDPGDDEDMIRGDRTTFSKISKKNRELLNEGKTPIEARQILRPIGQVPLDTMEDWIARLQHERLRSTIIEAAHRGWTSDFHGTHPIPGLALGVEFGKPTSSKSPY